MLSYMGNMKKTTTAFTRNTQKYLDTFGCILDEMIHGMMHARLSNSISHNFIVQMIPHHKAAIQMSHNVLKYTTNPDIECIASHIITEQTKSIENMEQILSCCSQMTNPKKDLCEYQNRIERVFQTMFQRMQNVEAVNSNDCNFLREMLPHHEGAVSFSEITLQYRICPELKPILDSIIVSQKQGICEMKELLCKLSC